MKKEDKKKILFVTESLVRGGMERTLVNISNILCEKGYEITVLCYYPMDALLPELNSKVRYIYKPCRPFPILRRIPYIKRYFNYRDFSWEKRVRAKSLYKYYVGKNNYDVEVGFYRGPSIKIISSSTNKKSKKFAWVHTDFKLCDTYSITNWFKDIEDTKKAYARMDRIVCVSDKAKESFNEVIGCNEKSTTIYNMLPSQKVVEKSKESISIEKDKFTIVTVGRLIADKRQDRLLSATKKLNDEGYDFNVWIVGGGRCEDELRKYCIENGIKNVTFFGMQENPYVYMKKADLFVLTSYREGFALVIPEAMACGLPILSTYSTGPTEILKDGEYGILVDNSSEGIYQGIKNVLDNKECLEHYRKKSKERYMDFDENKIVEEIIELFNG